MNGIDVSSLLLIEGSADSEADSGFPSVYPSMAYDNDDAESCNYEEASRYGASKVSDGSEDDGEFGEFSDDEYDSHWSTCGSTFLDRYSILPQEDQEEETKTDKVNINELEDRLFWEACIAVGYP